MAPILVPVNITPAPESKCDGVKQSGTVRFSFVVDQEGRARNIIFEQALGNDVDYTALRVMELDHFKPGTLNGDPVASFGAVEMQLAICVELKKDKSKLKSISLRLRAQPVQKYDDQFRPKGVVGDGQREIPLTQISDPLQFPTHLEKIGEGVSAPKVIHSAEAEFSDYARANHLQGTGVFSLVVDEHGFPHNMQFEPPKDHTKPLDPSLVQQGLLALRQYRFKPAMKDGMPVPVNASVEIDFRLY